MASVQVTPSDVLRHPHNATLVAAKPDACESDENSSTMSTSAITTAPPSLSRFERVLTTHPTIVESLLAQLPTRSLLDLYHTSSHLRAFLASYPLAWRTVSFRGPQPALGINQLDGDPADSQARNAKQYALDSLLIQVVVPFGTRLTSLDLCNTTVSGVRLVSRVLEPRVQTLQHLSVRGCKNVSIKYHLVPFLEPYVHSASPWANTSELALKSLYTYRCRHHRRRPYLPSSLIRRDSDSEPTHQLIEICHQLGIWTDTMWCTTPGGRCFRRKDYYSGRAAPGTNEVWVPFDRLWRSGNRIGPGSKTPSNHSDGRLWEDMETGQDGEPLGTAGGPFKGEGKDTPAHLRKSHKLFVEDIKCDQCNDPILERCEQCSIRMHCMGCRKTLCASCAFNRPIPRKRRRTNRDFTTQAFGQVNIGTTSPTHSPSNSIQNGAGGEERSRKHDRFWWAPGATRSPNLMSESTSDDDASDSDEIAVVTANPLTITTISTPPKLNMHWCCVEPVFSGGGGIVVLGPGVGGRGADRIRATPLPKGQQYEDPDFTSIFRSPDMIREMKNASLYDHVLGEQVDIVPYLMQESLDLQASSCPRSLCQDCYRTFRWRVQCKACKRPLCKEHDFRALKVRKCGYRELHVEREHIRSYAPATKASSSADLHIPPFVPPEQRALQSSPMAVTGSSDSFASSSGAEQQQNLSNHWIFGNINAEESALANSISSLGHSEPSIRPRALSASDNRPSRSSSPWGKSRDAHSLAAKSQERERARRMLPLPGSPRHPVQWRGCGAYFCQQLRPVGDCRPRCNAAMRECSACRVVVCDGCLDSNPPCKCAYCSTHYHCPTCALLPAVKKLCQRDAERAAAVKKKMEEEALRRMEAEALVRADEAAESVGQFFSNLFDVGSSLPSEWRDDLNRTEHIEVADEGARHRFILPQIESMTSPDVLDSTGAATYAESSAMGAARAAAAAAANTTTMHKESTPDEIRDAVMQMLSNMDYATVGQVPRRSLPSLDAAPHASSAQQPLEPQSATTETVAPGGVAVFAGTSGSMSSSHAHAHVHVAGAAEGGGVMVPPATTASSSSHHHHHSEAGSVSNEGGDEDEDDADDDTETDGEPHSSAEDEAPDDDDVDVDEDESPVISGSGSSAELVSVEA
ncbi:hypothetical protein IWX49DRAFT_541518 [Phyllosticta citricarpa]|uniref:Uncharacterized protein n=1 Tax=Phyllosticta paracitricarpa TaxID=2016321 RepID=A0ABR1N543_9PEZI